jgi:hypothetical protein
MRWLLIIALVCPSYPFRCVFDVFSKPRPLGSWSSSSLSHAVTLSAVGGGGPLRASTTEMMMAVKGDTGAGGYYLERMVERKKIEVDALLRRHQDKDDPLVMRMSYVSSECKFNVTRALKLPADGNEALHTMSVMVDMKRMSPTVPHKRNIVDFENAGKFAELLALSSVDALMVNTNEIEYGGQLGDLKECSKATRLVASKMSRISPVPCIAKDLIIHPVQVIYIYNRSS